MSRKLLRFRYRGLYPLPHSPNRGLLGVEVEVVKLNVIGVLRRGPCLELLAMNFHEQRRGPSRPLFSRARACPCPRRLCYEKPMPAAHAVALGPERAPRTRTTQQAYHAPSPSDWGMRVGAAYILKQGLWRRGVPLGGAWSLD